MVWCDEYENAYCTRERDEQALNHEVDHEDSADGSSIGGSVVKGAGEGESDGEEGAPSDTEGEAEPRGPDEYEDPDEYGERLVDEEDGQEGVEEAGVDKVRGWLRGQVVAGSRSGERSRKRKRRVSSDEQNPRSRPRLRLQATHGISDVQTINQEPAIRRKSIRQVCELYDLELDQLMQEVKRCAYLTDLPIFVDEFTDIDAWDTLRSHLHSTAYRSAAKMQ
ncbi:hypothetical protein FRC06_009084 [Ceratobasidium sp. 370]|nr:hypothetical protein FRC06_009084 [Ceratobasidium sp. 370]